MIKTFQRDGAESNKDRKELENFYYELIYQAIRNQSQQENTAIILRKMKAKILRLRSMHQIGVLMDTADKDKIPGEAVTIHQYIKSRKRRMARTVTHVTDEHGSLTTDQADIMRIFTDHMTRK
jgi:hypothetical protein